MKHIIFFSILLCTTANQTKCSLQEKITQSSDKISTLLHDIKSGKDLENTSPKCSKCCGNSCSKCSGGYGK